MASPPLAPSGSRAPSAAASPAAGPVGTLLRPADLGAVGLPRLTGTPSAGRPPFEVNPCFPEPLAAVSGTAPSAHVRLTGGGVVVTEQVVVTPSSAEAQRIGTVYFQWHTTCPGPGAATLRPGSSEPIPVEGGSGSVVTLAAADAGGDAPPVGYSFVVRVRATVAVVLVTGPDLGDLDVRPIVAAIATRLR